MGHRGEIFTTRIFADEGRKTYFFNVKENRYHDVYINVVESRKTDRGFRRSSIIIFQENIDKFVIEMDEVVDAIRRRKDNIDHTITMKGGRREYRLRSIARGKPTLQISEARQDATGSHRESVYIALEILDTFLDGFKKALTFMSDSCLES